VKLVHWSKSKIHLHPLQKARAMTMPVKEIGEYLVVDPEVCHGKMTFKGTRIPVNTILTFLGTGNSIDDILRKWPRLKQEAVLEALRYAADLVLEQYPGAKETE
jgi:uncharacterized protein (DUF433 family)